jgi:hypothetical protein
LKALETFIYDESLSKLALHFNLRHYALARFVHPDDLAVMRGAADAAAGQRAERGAERAAVMPNHFSHVIQRRLHPRFLI